MTNVKIILASSSPRRIEMFEKNGFNPEIIPSKADETIPVSMTKEQSVMYLALKKALSVENEWLTQNSIESDPACIIAADTIVYKDGIIGKPADYDDAVRILKLLRNSCHYVVTGVAAIIAGKFQRKIFYDTTEVYFKNYSDMDIQYYIENEEVLDKAGSYAIQSSIWRKNIDKISGDYNNVIGFPWDRFKQEFDALIK